MIRFGVIGLGNVAAMHAAALQKLADGRLHSCCSRDAKKAGAFAAQHGCRAYLDLTEFLADPQLDAVTICTPSGAHLAPALAAARAGKHLLIEKPLEISPARCQRIIDACRQHRVRLGTIFPIRFTEGLRTVKAAVDAGRLGKLVNASAYVKWYRSQEYYDTGGWRGTWQLDGGGCLMNQGIHMVDSLIWCGGDVIEVSAVANRPTRQRIEVETNLVATLQFANGALGVLEVSTETFPGSARRLELSGTTGTIVCADEKLLRWEFAKAAPTDADLRQRLAPVPAAGGNASSPMAFAPDNHRRQFQEFVDVLLRRTRHLSCDGRQGLRSVRLVNAIYTSVRKRRTVKVG